MSKKGFEDTKIDDLSNSMKNDADGNEDRQSSNSSPLIDEITEIYDELNQPNRMSADSFLNRENSNSAPGDQLLRFSPVNKYNDLQPSYVTPGRKKAKDSPQLIKAFNRTQSDSLSNSESVFSLLSVDGENRPPLPPTPDFTNKRKENRQENEKYNKRKRITFYGSGQVVAVEAGMIALANKKAIDEGRLNEVVDIVIIGREGSKTLRDMKQYGVNLRLRREADTLHEYHPPIVENNPDYSISFIEYNKKNPPQLLPSDHIVLGVKSFDFNEDFYDSVRCSINASRRSGRIPTILPIQNGITPWFMLLMITSGKGHVKTLEEEIELDRKGDQLLSEDDIKFLLFAKENGLENLMGCVVNISAERKKDENDRPYYISYTPVEKMSMPTDLVFSSTHMDDLQGISVDYSEFNKKRKNFVDIFNKGEICAELGEPELLNMVFKKICFNAIFNPICTLSNQKVSEVIDENGPMFKLVRQLTKEIAALAASVQILEIFPGQKVLDGLEARSKPSGPHYTSTWNDYMHCRMPENILDRLGKLAYNKGVRHMAIIELNIIFKEACSRLFESDRFMDGTELYSIPQAARDLGIEDAILLENKLMKFPNTIMVEEEEVSIFALNLKSRRERHNNRVEEYQKLDQKLDNAWSDFSTTQLTCLEKIKELEKLEATVKAGKKEIEVEQKESDLDETMHEKEAFKQKIETLAVVAKMYEEDKNQIRESLKKKHEDITRIEIEQHKVILDIQILYKEYLQAKQEHQDFVSSGIQQKYEDKKKNFDHLSKEIRNSSVTKSYEESRKGMIEIYDTLLQQAKSDFRDQILVDKNTSQSELSVFKSLLKGSTQYQDSRKKNKEDKKKLKEQFTIFQERRTEFYKVKDEYLQRSGLLLKDLGGKCQTSFHDAKDKFIQNVSEEKQTKYAVEIKQRFRDLGTKKIEEYKKDKKIEKQYPKYILKNFIEKRLIDLTNMCYSVKSDTEPEKSVTPDRKLGEKADSYKIEDLKPVRSSTFRAEKLESKEDIAIKTNLESVHTSFLKFSKDDELIAKDFYDEKNQVEKSKGTEFENSATKISQTYGNRLRTQSLGNSQDMLPSSSPRTSPLMTSSSLPSSIGNIKGKM